MLRRNRPTRPVRARWARRTWALAALLVVLSPGPVRSLPAAAGPGQAAAGPGQAAAGPGPLSLAEYVQRLEATRKLAEADATTPTPALMNQVRISLGLPLDVSVAGKVIHLARDPVLDGLVGDIPDEFRQAADQLAALEDAARGALAAQAGPPRPRERMAAALSDAFRGINSQPNFFARLQDDARAIWASILRALSGVAHRLHIPSYLLLVVGLAAVALVVVVVVRRLRYVVPERGSRSREEARARRTDWNRLAEEALARGDYRAALRARYGALLAALASRGVIPEAPSLTAGECRRAVQRGLPASYPSVERATSVFEAAFFGRAPVRREEVDAITEAERSVRTP